LRELSQSHFRIVYLIEAHKRAKPKQLMKLHIPEMKPSRIALLAVLCAAPALVLFGTEKSKKPVDAGPTARGKYLVGLGGCNDCHTPFKLTEKGPIADMSRLLSGHPQNTKLPPPELKAGPWSVATAGSTAWAGPWGISYAANLTPDTDTGLGIWTQDMFLKAMRTGRHMGASRAILPPMPWQGLAALTDDDLKAIYAYLQTIPPIRNPVPTPVSPDGTGSLE
jgi:mono/diheme cytochrome c family protein